MPRAGRNRLDEEESPYLRQHADNPVHWQPWDDAAFEEARERDVPVFLSVGYAACHWCHVMEEESFEDDVVASVLNDEYVPVKVDREERPDVDAVYMSVCQSVTGSGGWPLSVWLTPDGRPFHVGTYFPPEERDGTPGFRSLLSDLAETWRTDRERIEERADRWADAAVDRLEQPPGNASGDPPGATVLGDAADAVLRSADREHGGFGRSGPKFPSPARLELLLQAYAATDRHEPLDVAVETLDAMSSGGLYDQIGGGFHRYATDREWRVPHFEKMLYDNAELARVYLAAHQATGAARHAVVARETLAFVERELTHESGGFCGSLDARSEPPPTRRGGTEEGAFYVWTPAEVREALDDDETARLVCERYGIDADGNFEDGSTVPHVARSRSVLAERFGLDEATVERQLLEARAALVEARERRPRPRRDEKVIAAWNGLAVSAFAAGARVLDPALAEQATTALEAVQSRLWDADAGRLDRRYVDGVTGPGFLEDYAFLARGAFDCYQATGEVDRLALALDIARALVDRFHDPDRETLYAVPNGETDLVARPREPTDGATPSSLGVATDVLLRLDAFAPDDRFESVATSVLESHADGIRGRPTEFLTLAMAADRHDRGGTEIVVAADEVPAAWRDRLAEEYLPTAIQSRRPPTEAGLDDWLDRLGLDEAPPVWRGRGAREGVPTVYACQGRNCSPPATDIDGALAWLRGV